MADKHAHQHGGTDVYDDCCQPPDLEQRVRRDIAIWLRVHCDRSWEPEHEAVGSLAQRLIRVFEGKAI